MRSSPLPMKVPSSKNHTLSARLLTWSLINSSRSWRARAKSRGPSGSPCWTPRQEDDGRPKVEEWLGSIGELHPWRDGRKEATNLFIDDVPVDKVERVPHVDLEDPLVLQGDVRVIEDCVECVDDGLAASRHANTQLERLQVLGDLRCHLKCHAFRDKASEDLAYSYGSMASATLLGREKVASTDVRLDVRWCLSLGKDVDDGG
jgi:hypothetical protein